LGVGGTGALAWPLISARGAEAAFGDGPAVQGVAQGVAQGAARTAGAIRLDSNENPNGPSAAALDAIHGAFGEANRYPGAPTATLTSTVARARGVAAANVMLGCGSSEVLHMATRAFTSPTRPVVVASPTFEEPGRVAKTTGAAVRAVPVTGALKLDLAAMEVAARGAGLVYLCNPNNPTATVHGAAAVNDFVRAVNRASPETVVLVDEAYHEFVEDPSYATAIPLAMENSRVLVARTFSKIYGMAGLRAGYAIARAETIDALAPYRLPSSVNQLAIAGALASIGDAAHVAREQQRNHDAKVFTHRFFETAGYRVIPSDANFLMVDIRRDSKQFQSACAKRGVLIGRPFPPLTSYARISIGTGDEMRRAAEIFKQVLATA
jgi:histidinol-phosphate aminotransferase